MIVALGAFALAAACLAIGKWGRNNAAELVPSSYSAHGRAKQERSLRRGARSMTLFGWLLVVLGLVSLLGDAFGTGG